VPVNVLLALVGIAGVSASGPLMAGTQAPALAIALWRNLLATAVIVPVATIRKRDELRRVDRSDLAYCALAGLMLACHFGTWVTALKLTSVAAATALVCTQVGWVVLLDRLRGGTIPRAVVAGILVSFSGVLVISGVDLTLSVRALVGDLCALAGGLFAAVYMITGARVRRRLSTTTYTMLCYGMCTLVLAAACLVSGREVVGFGLGTWAGIVAVTVLAQLLGHSVFNHLLAVMSPAVVSLLLLLEVPAAALLAGLFLGQTPPIGVYVGLVLILVGLAVVLTRTEAEKQATPPYPGD
jgi:drug/metabolite transporter (DMT)-like permease